MKRAALVILFSGIFILFAGANPSLQAGEEGVKSAVRGNSAFAVDLYKHLRATEGNLFFSPYSISTALAMTYAGARGETEKEMASVLHFSLGPEGTHPAMKGLMQDLNTRKMKARYRDDPHGGKKPFELVVANALWGQQGFKFQKAFLDLTKKFYEAGLTELDFAGATEKSRETINKWVEKKTAEKIKDLIPSGMLTPSTTLVLTNAIYFKSPWIEAFKKFATREKPFHLTPDKNVKVPIMHRGEEFMYLEKETFRAVALPYVGNALSMILFVPKKIDGVGEVEEAMTAETLQAWIGAMKRVRVLVGLPKFKFTSAFLLGETLKAMGMKTAFSGGADFSGMTGGKDLFISEVIHKAFVDVNEEGTEAAAATAVVMERGRPPEPSVTLRIDRPFLFLIRDNSTGAILFMGRVTDPRG
jgi:serpin B